MKAQHHYLELREGEQVLKRIKTTLASENRDRQRLENFYKKSHQQILFVASSEKEKVIN